ncbi:hypothetical protein OIM90_02375 [Streptomyces sp. AD16]|nr:hypothetical protein OIM90_02375 [Streptomyces sp. AD16]
MITIATESATRDACPASRALPCPRSPAVSAPPAAYDALSAARALIRRGPTAHPEHTQTDHCTKGTP